MDIETLNLLGRTVFLWTLGTAVTVLLLALIGLVLYEIYKEVLGRK